MQCKGRARGSNLELANGFRHLALEEVAMQSYQVQIFHLAQIIWDAPIEVIVIQLHVLALSFALLTPVGTHIPHKPTDLSGKVVVCQREGSEPRQTEEGRWNFTRQHIFGDLKLLQVHKVGVFLGDGSTDLIGRDEEYSEIGQ